MTERVCAVPGPVMVIWAAEYVQSLDPTQITALGSGRVNEISTVDFVVQVLALEYKHNDVIFPPFLME